MKRTLVMLMALAVLAVMPAAAEQPAPKAEENPFFEEWTTPFGIPPFASIEEKHYMPAFERAISERRAEVTAIAASEEDPTFANTIEALAVGSELLTKVSRVFYNLVSADTNDQLQAIARELSPKMSALRDDTLLDENLFARVAAVWDARDTLELTREQEMLLEKTYKQFVRAGARLEDEKKARLREINAELSLLTLQFGENVLKATNAFRLVIEDEEDLAGLTPGQISAAAEAAKGAGLEDSWVFTLHGPSLWPFLQYAENRDLRRQMQVAYTKRGARGTEFDNTGVLSRMTALRAERANLLGYPSHAHYVLEENMAGTPERVMELLNQLWKPALKVAKAERDAMQAMIEEEGHEFALQPWDWWYYAEKVRMARYDLDEQAIRPYFKLENVRDGVFELARRLFGITFSPLSGVPTYHPEVETFEVKDADGSHLGVLMLDFFPRPGKRGGAWMSTYRDQWMENGTDIRPLVVNVGSFSRPAGDLPALLSLDEVRTLFHEFGHGLHGLLARSTYRTLSGTSVPRDFVEVPSQIMENWILEPEMLRLYARHYETDEVIPDEVITRLREAQKFNQGFATVEYLAASFLDMDWHTLTEPVEHDTIEFEKVSMKRIGLIPEIVPRYMSHYFNHIAGGYSAGYYSYIWSEVLDADAFQVFKENGLFDRETGMAFRRHILERGGTEDPMVMFVRFRGAEPNVEPLLVRRGLK